MSLLRLLSIMVLAALIPTVSSAAEGLSVFARDRGDVTEIDIGLDRRIGFRVFTLDQPWRVVVDLPALTWRDEAETAADGLVKGVRLGAARPGMGRLVIDLAAPARVVTAFTEAGEETPARLRLTLAPTPPDVFAETAGWPEDLLASRDEPEVPTPRPRPKRGLLIAIDAGHGGRDSGATHGDIDEKDLVLDYAFALGAKIDARPGMRAYLVRTTDEFIRLRERVFRARRAGADAMISLHADALESGRASGASVYTLSEEASDIEAAELVVGHNRADVIEGALLDDVENDVAAVLVDLARRRTDEGSVALAEAVVARLEARSRVLRGRALQSAGFRVLKAPDMPSILVELGFLSAAADRERLLSEEGRRALVLAIAEGVADWAQSAAETPDGG